MRLRDKVVLVTGATTGIGAAMSRLFRTEGARVMVHGEKPSGREPKEQHHVYGDLEDPAVPAKLVSETVDRLGRIDALVNNAAAIVRSDLETTNADLFDQVIAVNVRAPLLLIQAALPHFRRQKSGRVLNIGSVNSYCGAKNLLVYSVSKGAMMTLTRNLADAHGPEGVRVNQFNVGWTLSDREHQIMKEAGFPEDWAQKIPKPFAPSGRLLSPEDIAYAAVFFLSDEAQLINGAILDLEQYPLIGRNTAKDL